MRATTSGALSALATSSRSFASTGPGVFAGATRPYQEEASKPGRPCSATVGTLGSADGRFAPALASARALPAAICGNTTGMRSKNIWTCPAIKSFIAGPAPRYGTCTMSI